MAHFVHVTNPFDLLGSRDVSQRAGGITIRQWLEEKFPGFTEFTYPTLCLHNGKAVMRKDWATRQVADNDTVIFQALPGTALALPLWFWIVTAVLVTAVVVLAATVKTPNIDPTADSPEGESVFNLKGQRNQVRLGDPLEVGYGKCRRWPSYAAAAYNKYENNQQWLYQLFSMGVGEYEFHDFRIEDTPLSSYVDVEYEVVPPGGTVTLFPDNVVTAAEIANLELFGPNESAGEATWIEDSPGDIALGIPATGHWGYTTSASFIINPPATQTNLIELDLSLPRGLYVGNDSGGLSNQTVTALFEARLVDDAGAPLGAWFTLHTMSQSLATATPQRWTVSVEVPSGRYEVRGQRTNDKNTSARAANTLIWEACRAFLPSDRTYSDCTVIALKARASNNLNDNSSRRFNTLCTRKLRTWNGSAWTAPVATRSIVWAFCDIFQAEYGGRLEDAYLDLAALKTLDTFFEGREEYFDWTFDQKTTVWDAARVAALVGRAVPLLNGSQVTMVRDDPKTVATAVFNQENIVEGSFKWEIKLPGLDAFDGLDVEYINPTTWKVEVVECLVGDDAGTYKDVIRLNGCTDRLHAYNWGMWRRALERYQRENIVFSTGQEGHIPSYGDLIAVSHDTPEWGQGGQVLAIDGYTVTLSEPVTFGVGTHKIVMRKRNGDVTAPLTVTAGADAYHVVLAVAVIPDEFSLEDGSEPPIFVFGPSATFAQLCKVISMAPGEDNTVEITAVPYRDELYSQDTGTVPAGGDNSGNLDGADDTPTVHNLIVIASPFVVNEVTASWRAVRGAEYYVVEISYDGETWERVADFCEDTHFRFTVLERATLYCRVAAVRNGQGPWTYWKGAAPVDAALATYVSYIFIRASSQPDTPTGNTPAGWSDVPPAGTDPLWMSKATFYVTTDALVGVWSTPVNLKGDDGTDGIDGTDGKWVEFVWQRAATQPDAPTGNGIPTGWYDDPPAGADPLWMSKVKQELDGTLVTGESWSTPIRHDGPPGDDGESVFVEYSVNGTSGWHDTYAATDLYMRTKVGVGGTWSDAIRIVGEDGGYYEHLFKRSATQPDTPTGDAPSGWADAPPAADGNALWMVVGYKYADGTLEGVWSTPVQVDGDSIEVEYSVDGATSWHSTFTSGDLYMRQRIRGGTWSSAMRIIGEKGDAGAGSSFTMEIYLPYTGSGYYPCTVNGVAGTHIGGGVHRWTGLPAGDYVAVACPSSDGGSTFSSWDIPDTRINALGVLVSPTNPNTDVLMIANIYMNLND